jgi:type I restriction enzyme S subunit
VTGKTPPTKNPELFGDAFPFITPSDIPSFDSRYLNSTEKKISNAAVEKMKNIIVPENSILYTCIASIGKIAIAKEPSLTNQQINSIIVDPTKADFRYLFYLLRNLTPQIQAYVGGAATPIINKSTFENVKIELPGLEEQIAVGSLLFTFDDLIENNTKRIKILENIARLIYRDWFVYYHFPDHEKVKMVDSGTELGQVPEGWAICSVDELVEIQSGYPFKSGTFSEDGKWKLVTIKNVQDGYFVSECKDKLDELPSNMKEHCHLKDSDILMSLTGNIGRVCLVYGEDYVLNQRVAKLHPREERFRAYTYCKFRDSDFQKKLEILANGVAQQNLSPIETKRIQILKPTDEVMDTFDKLSSPMIRMISLLHKRNHYIRNTRDLLLPKLISGQLLVTQLA